MRCEALKASGPCLKCKGAFINGTKSILPRCGLGRPQQQEVYMAQSPQKPPEKSISDQAFQDMTDEQRRQEQQRRSQPASTRPEDGSSQNNYPGTGSPS